MVKRIAKFGLVLIQALIPVQVDVALDVLVVQLLMLRIDDDRRRGCLHRRRVVRVGGGAAITGNVPWDAPTGTTKIPRDLAKHGRATAAILQMGASDARPMCCNAFPCAVSPATFSRKPCEQVVTNSSYSSRQISYNNMDYYCGTLSTIYSRWCQSIICHSVSL